MAHPKETKIAVRRSYVFDRLGLEAAAENHGVSYHTARAWKKKSAQNGDDWDSARTASRMASGNLGDITNEVLEEFALLFQSTIEDLKTEGIDPLKKAEAISRLSDAYTKTMKAAGGGNAKLAELSIAYKMLDELSKFIREEYPEQLGTFALILEPFGAKISELFGNN